MRNDVKPDRCCFRSCRFVCLLCLRWGQSRLFGLLMPKVPRVLRRPIVARQKAKGKKRQHPKTMGIWNAKNAQKFARKPLPTLNPKVANTPKAKMYRSWRIASVPVRPQPTLSAVAHPMPARFRLCAKRSANSALKCANR